MPYCPLDPLPPRLGAIVPLLAEGLSNRHIAERLSLAQHTVENYVLEIKQAAGLETRGQLVLACAEWMRQRQSIE